MFDRKEAPSTVYLEAKLNEMKMSATTLVRVTKEGSVAVCRKDYKQNMFCLGFISHVRRV